MSSAKRRSSCSYGVVNLGLDVESDDQNIIYAESCDESVNLSSDELSSVKDAMENDSDDLANACIWCKVEIRTYH